MGLSDPDRVWRALAQASGRDASRYEITREWRKNDNRQEHVVRLLASDGEAVIFKMIQRPSDAQAFQTLLEAQMRAATGLGTGDARVPEVLEFDAGARAVLMQVAPGRTVFDLIEAGQDAQVCLRRAGRWIAQFHRATFAETRTFQPKFMRNHITHLLEQEARDEIAVASAAAFRRHAAQVIALGARFEGQKTVSAATHGDLNLRNILLDTDTSWGIDFSASHNAPVGFDIARLLLHYVGVMADLDQIPKGHVIAPRDLAAFFDGYDLVAAEDPSVQYLLRVRLLMDWASLPARFLARSPAKGRRLRRLEQLAEIALG